MYPKLCLCKITEKVIQEYFKTVFITYFCVFRMIIQPTKEVSFIYYHNIWSIITLFCFIHVNFPFGGANWLYDYLIKVCFC